MEQLPNNHHAPKHDHLRDGLEHDRNRLEDTCWGKLASGADHEKSLGKKATMDFLLSDE